MRKYETVMVLNPNLGEAQVKDEAAKIEKLLETNGAKEITNSVWGKKEIAYEFQKQRFGYYVAFNYESANHEAPNELKSVLRITDSVHKFQTHRVFTKTRKFKGNPRRLTQPRTDLDDYDFGGDFE